MEMNDIQIKKNKKDGTTSIKIELDTRYTQCGQTLEKFKPLKITVNGNRIHIGNLMVKGNGRFKDDGLNREEVYTLIKALKLAIAISNYKLEIK